MMRTRFAALGLAVVSAGVLCVPSAHAAKAKPDATVELSGGSVAAGIGYSWGSGTLTYKGAKYPITVDGLSAGSVGATNVTASGKVYHLKKLADFEGNYTAVSAGATVGGGGSVSNMQNQNGVVIHMVSTTQGLKFSLAAGGVKMQLKK
ncbi:MAG TPA: DUF1134 domain-containing protein [Myxococcota bacterium]|nr:DUF1134 domain-containing protein [Myxococcota bacterium]